MKRKTYIRTIFLVLIAFTAVAFLSEKFYFRMDLTEGGQYSLSSATKNILKDLDKQIMVTAYFTDDLPPHLEKIKGDFKDMLIEYRDLSNGNINFKFIDPNSDKEVETEARAAGVQPVLYNARDKNEVKQQKIYMGAKLSLDDKKDAIPFINSEQSIEFLLTTAIKKLSVKEKPMIGFVQGQGEPPLAAYAQVKAELDVLYDVREVYLSDTVINIHEYQTLVISGPKTPFNDEALRVLENYVSRGGNLFIAMNRVNGNTQTLQGEDVVTGLENWLLNKGINMDNKFVVDANCGMVSVSQPNGRFTMTTQVKFPFLPAINNFADFPVTKGLEQIMLGFPSPIVYTGDSSSRFTPLAYSSKNSGLMSLPLILDVQKKWSAIDFQDGQQVVAALLEMGNTDSKIIIVSAGDFAVNGTGQRPRQVQADNVNLMANSIEWLSDETGLIDLRTKSITSRPIDQMSDSKQMFLSWLNFLLPMVLVVLYGIIRLQMRRNQRMKRMHKGYVK
jgi:gliding-associated putative ABC transporter substrate-binding component GldG